MLSSLLMIREGKLPPSRLEGSILLPAILPNFLLPIHLDYAFFHSIEAAPGI